MALDRTADGRGEDGLEAEELWTDGRLISPVACPSQHSKTKSKEFLFSSALGDKLRA